MVFCLSQPFREVLKLYIPFFLYFRFCVHSFIYNQDRGRTIWKTSLFVLPLTSVMFLGRGKMSSSFDPMIRAFTKVQPWVPLPSRVLPGWTNCKVWLSLLGLGTILKWSHSVWLFVNPWTVAYHAPPYMRFSRQEYWSGLPFPSPEDLPDPGIEPRSPAL